MSYSLWKVPVSPRITQNNLNTKSCSRGSCLLISKFLREPFSLVTKAAKRGQLLCKCHSGESREAESKRMVFPLSSPSQNSSEELTITTGAHNHNHNNHNHNNHNHIPTSQCSVTDLTHIFPPGGALSLT